MPVGLIDGLLDAVWSGGAAHTSQNVPVPFIVAINGREYLQDLEFKPWKRQAFRATTTTSTRTQADSSNEPGEQSLSTEQLWRRTQDSWHMGAGQRFLDRKTSTEFGFRQSKGIDPWTQWQLSLQPETSRMLASVNSNGAFAVAGAYLYMIDGQQTKWTSDMITFHTVTGMPAVTASSICSDGYNVWVAYGADGVYTTTAGASAGTQYITSAIDSNAIVRYCLGRLMVGSLNNLYNPVASGALPTALIISDYSNLTWCDIATGNGCIFAAGNSGQLGLIYSIQIQTDGTALSAPILCGQLPNGENVNCIYGYAGSGLAIGTSLGVRWAEQALANSISLTVSLNIGPVTYLGFGDTPQGGVTCFSGFNRFVWGSYANFDSTSTGLFRMDPTNFVADLTPAIASDVMATAQGQVTSVAHFLTPGNAEGPTPVFAIAANGFWEVDQVNYVGSGYIDSGLITYGLADDKRPVFVNLSMEGLSDTIDGVSIQTLVSLDGGAFVSCGTATSDGQTSAQFNTPQDLATTIEVREILSSVLPGFSDGTVTPVLTGHTLRCVPAPVIPTDWNVVIQLREGYLMADNSHWQVPSEEYAFLDDLRANHSICNLQIGNLGPYQATIESIDWIPEQAASLSGELNGVAVLTMRTVV